MMGSERTPSDAVSTDGHLLVTNDFPPKVGGIQNYLWELWRRLPSDSFSVYTTPYRNAAAFDAAQDFAIERSPEPFLIPYPWLSARIRRIAARRGHSFVVLDPAVPLGAVGPGLGLRYGVVLHGAEVTIPGRLPISRNVLAKTLDKASFVLAAGNYSLAEAERCVGRSLPAVVIPPGVDVARFTPLSDSSARRRKLRMELGVDHDDVLLSTVTRLVPRKGIDTVIKAAARYMSSRTSNQPDLHLVIGGEGRERDRLIELSRRLRVKARFPGRVDDQRVVELYQAADVMAMACNERWFGLEQEGFGIVFLEAAACGVPAVAGRSGGSHEAVEHGVSGLIADNPNDVRSVADALEQLVVDGDRRRAMSLAARERVVTRFTYDRLADQLSSALVGVVSPQQ